MTPERMSAIERMEQAKRAFTQAAGATLRGDPDAPAFVESALRELDAARQALLEAQS
jgi:hypothetical protein